MDTELPGIDQSGQGFEAGIVGLDRKAGESAPGSPSTGGKVDVASADDGDKYPARAQHADGAARDLAAERVEHHVQVADHGREVARLVVDRLRRGHGAGA